MRRQQSTILIAVLVALLCLLRPLPSPGAEADPAAQHFYRASMLYNRGMSALAAAEFKLFLEKYPDYEKAEDARYGLALSYYAAGKYAEAEPVLKALAERGLAGDREQLALLRGQCLFEMDKPADAAAVFTTLLRSRSESVVREALAGLVAVEYARGEWKSCLTAADKLLAGDPSPERRRQALLLAARASRQLGQPAAALAYLGTLQPLVKDDPTAQRQVALFLAELYSETGQPEKAAGQYSAAASGFTDDIAADIQYRLGLVRFKQGKYDDAIAALDESLKLRKEGGSSAEAQLQLGRAWLEKGDFNKAIQILRPLAGQIAPRESPADAVGTEARFAAAQPGVRAALWLARAYSRQERKRYDEAVTVLAEAIDKTMHKGASHCPLLPELYFDQGNALMAEQKFAEAAAVFAKLLPIQDWPQANDAMRLHAVCLHRAGNYAESLKAAEAFLGTFTADPQAGEVFFVRAENLYLMSRFDDAAEAYARFLEKYPEDPNVAAASFRLGTLHHQQGRWAEALKALAPALARQPEGQAYNQLHFMAGDASYRLGQWAEAVTNLTAFVEAQRWSTSGGQHNRTLIPPSEPNVDSALIELALAQVNQGNAEEAMSALRRLIDWFGESVHRPLALSELGRLQYEAGDLRGAHQSLSSFLQLYANHSRRPKAEYYLGWIALRQNQSETAGKHFAVVAGQYAEDSLAPDAALQLGMVQISLNNFEAARSTLERLIKLHPQHPRMDLVLFSSGVANARMERWEEAANNFRQVAEDFPQSAQADAALYEWAWCEKGMNRNAEAIARYRDLIETYPGSDLRLKAEVEMADLTYDAGNYDKTIARLQKIIGEIRNPADKESALYRLGTAHFNKGDFAASAQAFEAFLQQYPQSGLRGSALFQAGESRMQTSDLPRARDHFQAASGIPGLPPPLRQSVLLRLGEALALTGQWPESASVYGQFLREFPQSQWVRNANFGSARALHNSGDFERAMRAYQSAIDKMQRDLLSARAQFHMGECLFAQKNYDAAIRELVPVHTAYRYRDWAAKALLETARIMAARGDREQAVEQFKEVIRRFPDDAAAVAAKEHLDEVVSKVQ